MHVAPLTALLLFAASTASAQDAEFDPVTMDPVSELEPRASNDAFTFKIEGSSVNALVYWPPGKGPHPVLLMLHGFPGNEKNLDLAQVARRAGWAVMFFHYRGSWGSEGDFSFLNAASDARAALALLRDPDDVFAGYIDPERMAVFGHSMGGGIAADLLADEQDLIGAMLLDPWNIGAEAVGISSVGGRQAWDDSIATSLPPLHGASTETLADEILANEERLSLGRSVDARGNVPVFILSAEGVMGNDETYAAITAHGTKGVTFETWPTDHSFNDRRIALGRRLVQWLEQLQSKSDQ